jgi:hypothetical protein
VVEENGARLLRTDLRKINASHLNILDHFEAVLIHTAEPKLNRRGGNFGNGVEQYLQHRDEVDLGPCMEDQVRKIYEGL